MAKYTGTDGEDTYTLKADKRDVVRMLGGDDTVYFDSASFGSDDRIDAGKGNDTAVLTAGGFYNISHERFLGFESMILSGEGRFELYVDDSVVPDGKTLSISADALPKGSTMFIDGQPERDGSLVVHASAGDDVLIGTGQADTFYGGMGKDLMTGNEGENTFVFEAGAEGDIWGKDNITDFHPGEDHLVFVTNSVTSFDQLLIERTRVGLVIRTPDSSSSVTLQGVLPRDLDASDVTFLPLQHDPAAHAPAFLHDHGLLV